MSLHLVCGDSAAGALQKAMQAGFLPDAPIRVLRDDLAVGPLAGIDQPPCQQRADFWHRLGGDALAGLDIAADLSGDASWLGNAAEDELLVWHGDSTSEQLMLRRIAALVPAQQVLREVAAGCGECRVGQRQAVSMLSPDQLTKALAASQPLAGERRAQLANEWRHWREQPDDLRLWLGGQLSGASFTLIDQALLQRCSDDWQPARKILSAVMAETDGLFVTDLLAAWRLGVLLQQGVLQSDGDDVWHSMRVRRPQAC
ncbi:hypothetical protein D3C78_680890 [compost metagenome]